MNTKKGKLTMKVQASTVLFILVASSLFVAAPAFMPKAAAAVTGTVTLSHAKLYGNSTLRIIVADADINAVAAPAPDLKLTITPTPGTPGVPIKLNVTQLSDGSWVAHLTDGKGTPIVNATTGTNSETNGILTGPAAIARIQNHGALMPGRYGTLVTSPVKSGIIQVENFTRLDTLTFTYNDAAGSLGGATTVSTSITFDYSTTTIGNDRDVVGAGNSLFLTVTDQDKNRDPTKADRFQVNASSGTAFLVPSSSLFEIRITTTNSSLPPQTTLRKNITGGTSGGFLRQELIETGPNTNIFAVINNVPFNLTSVNATTSTILPRALLHGDTIQIRVVDAEASAIVGTDSARATKTLTVTKGLGPITLSATTLRYNTDVTLTLTDPDRNNSTQVKEKLQVRVQTGSTVANVTMYETATDSGIFQGQLRATVKGSSAVAAVTLSSGDINASSHVGARLTANIRAGEVPTMQVRYVDYFVAAGTNVASVALNFERSTISSVTLALDKASYGQGDLTAIVTLSDPDLNDSTGQEILNKLGNHTLKLGSSSSTGDSIGTLHLVIINGSTSTQHIVSGLRFRATSIETSGTSATFAFNIPLSNFTITSADQIRVSYLRNFDSQRINATATIGGTLATVRFDRTDFPIAPGNRVNATIVVVDPDSNVNVAATESLTARIYVRNATDNAVGNKDGTGLDATLGTRKVNYYNLTLTETGSNTGNFTVKLMVVWGSSSVSATTIANYSSTTKHFYNLDRTQDLIGGRLHVCVADGLAPSGLEVGPTGTLAIKGVCGAVSFAVHNAVMTANVTSGKVGLPVSFTLTEPDMNADAGVVDKVNVRYALTRGTTTPTDETTTILNTTMTMTETGTNTGVFTNASKLGTGLAPFSQVNASQFLRVRYQDDASLGSQSAVGLARAKATASVVIGSTTGTATTSPATEVGPFSTIVITIVDADLAFNKTRVVLDKITSEHTSDEVNSIVAVKANRTTGTYTFNVTISFSTSPVTTDQILQVNSTDRIHVFYTDRLNSAGGVEIIEKIIRVVTGDGKITADKTNYLVGEFVTITIVDTDANRDSTLREFVRPVVTTDSWTVGTNITLQETAADTGIFVGQVQITDTFPGAGQVLGRIGDSITVRYIDLLAADRQRKIITVSPAKIGTSIPKTQQVPAGVPATVDANGNALTSIRAGDLVAIRAKVTNNDTASHIFTYLVQVKDANGVVVNLAFIQDITLAAGGSTSPALSWIPSRAGTYTVEVFVWESLANPIALSPLQKITVTVG